MKPLDVQRQSEAAYGQWKEKWREHAERARKFSPFKSLGDFVNSGVGKAALMVANGASLEEEIETIKKHQDNVDIFCCDKTLGHLIDNGITPDFCFVCDAVVDYETYMKPWEDKLQDTVLFTNVCGNPQWFENGNWKDRYFFVNQDVIKSEVEFMNISGCKNVIPAATNVSNAMVVFITQCTNEGRNNFFGYDKILLIGYDYSWEASGKYYAFDDTGNGKHNYMRHIFCYNIRGRLSYSSSNLTFSAQWLEKYVSAFKLPVVQCSGSSILSLKYNSRLKDHIGYKYKMEDRSYVRKVMKEKAQLINKISKIDRSLVKIGKDHLRSFLSSV